MDALASIMAENPQFGAVMTRLSEQQAVHRRGGGDSGGGDDCDVAGALAELRRARESFLGVSAEYSALQSVCESSRFQLASRQTLNQTTAATEENRRERTGASVDSLTAAAAAWQHLRAAEAVECLALGSPAGQEEAESEAEATVTAAVVAPTKGKETSVVLEGDDAETHGLDFSGISGQPDTLLGLRPEDVRGAAQLGPGRLDDRTAALVDEQIQSQLGPGRLDDRTAALVDEQIQSLLAREYALAAAVLLGEDEAAVRALDEGGEVTDTAFFLEQTPLHQQAIRLKEQRVADEHATRRARLQAANAAWKRHDILLKKRELLEYLIRDIKLKEQLAADELAIAYNERLIETIDLKQRSVEQKILSETYTAETIPALRRIENHINQVEADTTEALRAAKDRLAAYNSLGPEFVGVARQYSEAVSVLQEKTEMLQQLQQA